jgi:hypothetical protein
MAKGKAIEFYDVEPAQQFRVVAVKMGAMEIGPFGISVCGQGEVAPGLRTWSRPLSGAQLTSRFSKFDRQLPVCLPTRRRFSRPLSGAQPPCSPISDGGSCSISDWVGWQGRKLAIE